MTTVTDVMLDVDGQSILDIRLLPRVAGSFPYARDELLGFQKRDIDEFGIPTTVNFYRKDRVLHRRHELSGGEAPFYTTFKATIFAPDGVTPKFEWEYALSYDGALIAEKDFVAVTNLSAGGSEGSTGGDIGFVTGEPAGNGNINF